MLRMKKRSKSIIIHPIVTVLWADRHFQTPHTSRRNGVPNAGSIIARGVNSCEPIRRQTLQPKTDVCASGKGSMAYRRQLIGSRRGEKFAASEWMMERLGRGTKRRLDHRRAPRCRPPEWRACWRRRNAAQRRWWWWWRRRRLRTLVKTGKPFFS